MNRTIPIELADQVSCTTAINIQMSFCLECLTDSCTGKSMEKLQDLKQSELQDLLDNSERVASMAQESDEVRFNRFHNFFLMCNYF